MPAKKKKSDSEIRNQVRTINLLIEDFYPDSYVLILAHPDCRLHTSILFLVTKFSSFKKTSLKQAFEIARITNFEVVIWSPKREKWSHSFSYAFFFFSLLVFQSLKHYSFCNFTEWKIHDFHLNDIISHIREKWLRQKKRVSRGIKSHYILVTKFSNLKEYLQYPTEACEVLSPIKSPHGCPLNSLFLASVACIFNQTSQFCICKGNFKYNVLYRKEKDPLTHSQSWWLNFQKIPYLKWSWS